MDLMNPGSGTVGIDRRMVEAQRKKVEELRRLRASRMKAKGLSENANTSNSLDRQIQAILSEALSIDEQLANLDNLDVSSDRNKSKFDEDAVRLKAVLFRKPKLATLTSLSVVHIDAEKRENGVTSGEEKDGRKGDLDSYEKGTQCDDELTLEKDKGDTKAEVVAGSGKELQPTSLGSTERRRSSVRNPIFPRRGSTALDRMKAAARVSNHDNLSTKSMSQPLVESLTEEEKDAICQRRDFRDFLQRASKIVEKAIGISELSGYLEVDPFIDYATDERLRDPGGSAGKESAVLRVTERIFACFGEDGRLGEITDLRWHGGLPELFIACSGAGSWQWNNNNRRDSCPSVAVWSIAMPKRPEFVLKSHTAVVTAMSDKFNPTLYVGGSISGSVLIWDTRAKFSPVQWSPAVGGCVRDDSCTSSLLHTQPICGMELVGTRNAHHITTVSREGKVCLWSTAQLNEPHHSVLLKDANQKDYSVSTVAFSETDANLITFGTYDGHIVKAQLDTTTGNTNPWQIAKASALGHDGMVTALDYHPLRSLQTMQKPSAMKRQADNIIASGSLDWTVKLWNSISLDHNGNVHRDSHANATDLAGLLGAKDESTAASIATVDSYKDTLTDVRWHPRHPAILATSSAEGVHICNFNHDTESPILSIRTPGSSVQRLAWNGDGRILLAGDAEGRVTLYEADRNIYQPRASEWNRFEERLLVSEGDTTADEL